MVAIKGWSLDGIGRYAGFNCSCRPRREEARVGPILLWNLTDQAYGLVAKRLSTFLVLLLLLFYAVRSLVPVGHFRNISGHLFTWLVCGSFQ